MRSEGMLPKYPVRVSTLRHLILDAIAITHSRQHAADRRVVQWEVLVGTRHGCVNKRLRHVCRSERRCSARAGE